MPRWAIDITIFAYLVAPDVVNWYLLASFHCGLGTKDYILFKTFFEIEEFSNLFWCDEFSKDQTGLIKVHLVTALERCGKIVRYISQEKVN